MRAAFDTVSWWPRCNLYYNQMRQVERNSRDRAFISYFNEVVEIPEGLGEITTTQAGDMEVRLDNTDPIQVATMQVFFDRMILNGYVPHTVTPSTTNNHSSVSMLLREFDASAECIIFASMKVFVG